MVIKYFISISIFCLLFLSHALKADFTSNSLCSNNIEIKSTLKCIQTIHEGKDLIQKATSKGPIIFTVDYSGTMPFEAMWDGLPLRPYLNASRRDPHWGKIAVPRFH